MNERSVIIDAAIAAGQPPVWVLSLSLLDGRIYRLASVPAGFTDDAGRVIATEPGLVITEDFSAEYDAFGLSGVASLDQVRVGVVVTDSLAGLQSDWLHFSATKSELVLIWPGQSWDARTVILSGARIQAAELGRAGELSSFTLESTPPVASASIGAGSQDMGVDWPDPLQDDLGADMTTVTGVAHSFVLGRAYRAPAFKVGVVGGLNRLILCGHHLADLSAINVYENGVLGASYTPQNVTSASGQDYAYVEDATDFRSTAGAFSWDARDGGVAVANGVGPAFNAGDILTWLLDRSGLAVDWLACLPALDKLAEWNIGFYLDQQANAIDVIRDRLVRYLPLVEFKSSVGVWFAYVDPSMDRLDGELILGQHLVGRIGRMRIEDEADNTRNSFSARWGYDPFSDGYAGTVTLDPSNSVMCYLSDQLFGPLVDDPIDLSMVREDFTALRVLTTKANRVTLPRRSLTYVLAPDQYHVDIGWCGLVTDPDYSITRHRALVTTRSRGKLAEMITLTLIDRTPVSLDHLG